jgi:uncharacterized protein YaaR (DUF327 family)
LDSGGTAIGEARLFSNPVRESAPSQGRGLPGDPLDSPFGASFESTLQGRETSRLFADLDQAAERLFRYPSQKVLEEYREAVGRLLEKAQERIELRMDFSLPTASARILLVERTQACLRELERVLRREAGRTRIMGLTEEIRGCLLSICA